MNISELKDAFFEAFPNSANTYDRQRFIRYAFACAREGVAFNRDDFEKAGVESWLIDQYEVAYSYIRDIVEMQGQGEEL